MKCVGFTNQMEIHTCGIVFACINDAVINVLVTFLSCVTRIAQAIEAIDNCNK